MRPAVRLEDLPFDDQKKVALKLSDKKGTKRFRKIEGRKQKVLRKVSKYNGELSDKDKTELEIAERNARPTRHETITDPEMWVLKRNRDWEAVRKLEAARGIEPIYSSSVPMVDIFSRDNKYELFNRDGDLINVNGVCIDSNGDPVYTEVLSNKGVTLYVNEIDVNHIKQFQGFIRDKNKNLVSMKGAAYREKTRDSDGRLIAINGKPVLDNREDIKNIAQRIENMANGERNNVKNKILGKVGIKSRRLSIKEACIKQIHDRCIKAENTLKAKAKRAKEMAAFLKNQDKADKKAHEQESKNRAKLLKKEQEKIENQKKRELQNEAKERKLEEERKIKNAKLKKEARKIAGIEVFKGDDQPSTSNDNSTSTVSTLEDFPTTICSRNHGDADKSKEADIGSFCATSDESGDDEVKQTGQSIAEKDNREKIKALLEIRFRKKSPAEPTESVDPRTLTLEQMVEGDNEAMEEFEDSVKFQNHAERHKERILRLTKLEEFKRRKEEQIKLKEKQKQEEEEDIRKEKEEFRMLVNKATGIGPVDSPRNDFSEVPKHQEKMDKLEQSYHFL